MPADRASPPHLEQLRGQFRALQAVRGVLIALAIEHRVDTMVAVGLIDHARSIIRDLAEAAAADCGARA